MEHPKAMVSQVPEIRQSPVHNLSPRAISRVVLEATLPRAPAAFPPPVNWVPKSTPSPIPVAISRSFSLKFPAA